MKKMFTVHNISLERAAAKFLINQKKNKAKQQQLLFGKLVSQQCIEDIFALSSNNIEALYLNACCKDVVLHGNTSIIYLQDNNQCYRCECFFMQEGVLFALAVKLTTTSLDSLFLTRFHNINDNVADLLLGKFINQECVEQCILPINAAIVPCIICKMYGNDILIPLLSHFEHD